MKETEDMGVWGNGGEELGLPFEGAWKLEQR